MKTKYRYDSTLPHPADNEGLDRLRQEQEKGEEGESLVIPLYDEVPEMNNDPGEPNKPKRGVEKIQILKK